MLDLVADGLLITACLGMALYCAVLSRKISKLNQFETGLGGAIAVLSAQVDDVQKTLSKTEKTAKHAGEELKSLLKEANTVAGKLDLMLAGLDDLPDEPPQAEVPAFKSSERKAAPPPEPEEEPIVAFSHRRTTRVA